jgi:hypothetical protein
MPLSLLTCAHQSAIPTFRIPAALSCGMIIPLGRIWGAAEVLLVRKTDKNLFVLFFLFFPVFQNQTERGAFSRSDSCEHSVGTAEYRQGHRPCESRRNESPGGATEYLPIFWVLQRRCPYCTIGAHYRHPSPLRGYCGWGTFTGASPLPVFRRPSGALAFIIIAHSVGFVSARSDSCEHSVGTAPQVRPHAICPRGRTWGSVPTCRSGGKSGQAVREHPDPGYAPPSLRSPIAPSSQLPCRGGGAAENTQRLMSLQKRGKRKVYTLPSLQGGEYIDLQAN